MNEAHRGPALPSFRLDWPLNRCRLHSLLSCVHLLGPCLLLLLLLLLLKARPPGICPWLKIAPMDSKRGATEGMFHGSLLPHLTGVALRDTFMSSGSRPTTTMLSWRPPSKWWRSSSSRPPTRAGDTLWKMQAEIIQRRYRFHATF